MAKYVIQVQTQYSCLCYCWLLKDLLICYFCI